MLTFCVSCVGQCRWVTVQFLARFGMGRLRTVALRTFALSGLRTVHRPVPHLERMNDPITRLNAAREGRYCIESELGEGGMPTVYAFLPLPWVARLALA